MIFTTCGKQCRVWRKFSMISNGNLHWELGVSRGSGCEAGPTVTSFIERTSILENHFCGLHVVEIPHPFSPPTSVCARVEVHLPQRHSLHWCLSCPPRQNWASKVRLSCCYCLPLLWTLSPCPLCLYRLILKPQTKQNPPPTPLPPLFSLPPSTF